MTSYTLSRRAEADLARIFDQSIRQFGLNQAQRYRHSILNCLSKLAEFPRMGRSAPALGRSVRRHEHQSHVILYETAENGILILALVHARRRKSRPPFN